MKTHRYVYCFIIMLFLIESVYSANQEPYKRRTPWPAPGIIEAENFDTGGEGISYHDTTDKQLGNEYRKGAVDIFIGPENINIGWTDAGEWLEYTIKVKKKGQYYITARVANADNQKAAFHAEIDGKNITGTVKVPVLKTWDRFVMVNSEIFALHPGTHVIRIVFKSYFSLDFFGVMLSQGMTFKKSLNKLSDNIVIVDKNNFKDFKLIVNQLNEKGSGIIILDKSCPRGDLPITPKPPIRILDLRYNDSLTLIRGKHPRIEGIWPQYSNLKTGLAKNVIISDVLTPDTPIESWKSEPKEAVSTEFTSEFDYADSHNHYQNLLSEVWNFTPNINGVAIWGDSGSFVPGSKAWGGFLSARSWPLHWDKYVPGSAPKFKDENFDAQLVGLEIDVLNGGLDYPKKLPGAKGPLAKTGLQIVGFGARNSAAIEIRSEDSDAAIDHDKRRGTWDYGIIAHNALDKDSTLLFAAYPEGRRGVDLEMADFSEGAIRLKSAKEGTGIIFNGGKGGEIYIDADNTLVLKAGKGGIKMINEYGIAISLVSEGGGIFRGWLISFLLVLALIALAINTVACWDKIIVLLKKMRLEKQTLITTRRS